MNADATSCGGFFDRLADARRPPIFEPVAVVVAHPDDEVIGLGAQLSRFRNVTLVHVTDGSPRDLSDARRAGFSSARDYAEARRKELKAVLNLLGVPRSSAIGFPFRDQEAVFHFAEIARRLRNLFERERPHAVFTHPYEGGHPDHDAVACAVHTACSGEECAPCIIEMTSYHQGERGMVTGRFLPCAGTTIQTLDLSPEEIEFKRRLFETYRTQQAVLGAFSIDGESFRIAPRYDFLSAPHPGSLYYESLGFGMTGPRFRALIQAGLARIAL